MKLAAIFTAFLLALAPPHAQADEIRVSAAASLQDVISDIARTYTATTGENVTFAFGSSGQLATQIKDGAPVDVFISAAARQVDDLDKASLTLPGSRRVVVGNTLVLITPGDAKDPPSSFADLADPKHKRIAIGEPKTVPAGEYASQTFASLKLTDKLQNRLIFGTNVRQVLTYVENSEVAAGVVYLTDAKQSGSKVKVAATADPATHEPIVYPGVVIKASRKQAAALKFLDFLKTEPAKKSFTEKGFATVTPANSP